MKVFKISVLGIVCILCFASCNDGKVPRSELKKKIEKLNEQHYGFVSRHFPLGNYLLIGEALKTKGYKYDIPAKVSLEQFKALEEKGLIKLETKQHSENVVEIWIDLTESGKEYQVPSEVNNVDGTSLTAVRLYHHQATKITKVVYDDVLGTGNCFFDLACDWVTPFGEILGETKAGDSCGENSFELKKTPKGEWYAYSRYLLEQ